MEKNIAIAIISMLTTLSACMQRHLITDAHILTARSDSAGTLILQYGKNDFEGSRDSLMKIATVDGKLFVRQPASDLYVKLIMPFMLSWSRYMKRRLENKFFRKEIVSFFKYHLKGKYKGKWIEYAHTYERIPKNPIETVLSTVP